MDKIGAIGIPFWKYRQILVFKDKTKFELMLNADPNMEPILGDGAPHSDDFPGVYIAGIKASLPEGKTEARHVPIQE